MSVFPTPPSGRIEPRSVPFSSGGADVNARHPDGASALHWAVHWQDTDMARLLIRAGADVNAVNEYGVMPLSLACANGDAAGTLALLEARANPNVTLPPGRRRS